VDIEIITPDKELYKGKVKRVKLPGSMGSFEILNNHAPIISSLEKGTIRVTEESGDQKFIDCESGFVEVVDNKIIVLI